MAVAPALSPSTDLSPATGLSPGQGNHPLLWVQYSTDEASDTDPLWQDATAAVRGFDTSRGRNSELDEVDAGTASLILSNRDRTFDPTVDATIRPMNRWRIWGQPQGSNTTESIFVGYAESYDQQWPGGGKDAVAVVSMADEFKVLALDRLPTMSPPRDTYADLIMSDEPTGYWRMNNASGDEIATAQIGQNLAHILAAGGGMGTDTTPIVGDLGFNFQFGAGQRAQGGAVILQSGSTLVSPEVGPGDSGDVTGLPEFSLELWFKFSANPGADRDIIIGPTANSASTYVLKLLTTGAVRIEARNSAATNHTATSSALSPATWYYIAATIEGGNLRLYINGTQVAATAFTPSFHATLTAGTVFTIGTNAGTDTHTYDEVATYRYGLTATRVLAHYTAGTSRGFVAQTSGARVQAILEAVASQAPRDLDAGVRDVIPRFMAGQDPLGEIRIADRADDPDSVFFAARNGTLVYLDGDHRASSPYNTVQATFDDDGTDLPYQDLDVDYSETFLANEVNVTRIGGALKTASDSASIAAYYKRSLSITDLPVTSDADAQNVADAMLAKYKDPMQRINSLVVTTADPDAAEAVLARDIGDRIRLFRTPPGGGARIDQTLFVQKISWSADANSPVWRITLGVSPL